jgi:hypothetical protein
MILYHYTSLHWLESIRIDGFIRPSEANASPTKRHATPDVVWLTTAKSIPADGWSRGGAFDKTAARLTVDVPIDAVMLWLPDYIDRHDVPEWWVNALIESGGGYDHAKTWWVHEGPIFADNIIKTKARVTA